MIQNGNDARDGSRTTGLVSADYYFSDEWR